MNETIIIILIFIMLSASTTPLMILNPAFAQSPTPVCADATFTPPLPQSFTNGTLFPFTVNFGTNFSTVSEVAAISTYDPADGFGNGDKYFIQNYGSKGTQSGDPENTNTTHTVVDPIVLSQFVDGSYQDTYVDERGQFTLTLLKFCIIEEPLPQPLPPGVCPEKYVQHLNSITFQITSPLLAEIVDQQEIGDYNHVTVNSTLQYIEKTSPGSISLPHEKIIEKIFPNSKEYRNIFEKFIKIIDINYSTLCAEEYNSGTDKAAQSPDGYVTITSPEDKATIFGPPGNITVEVKGIVPSIDNPLIKLEVQIGETPFKEISWSESPDLPGGVVYSTSDIVSSEGLKTITVKATKLTNPHIPTVVVSEVSIQVTIVFIHASKT